MLRKRYFAFAAIAAGVIALVPALGVGPTFKADQTFKGSSLTGWHSLGAANWKADKGELIGSPTSAEGGWLVFDKSLQDVGFYANFQCTGGCKTGLLLRAEKTATGMKGVFVSLNSEDLASYALTLDANGRELSRTKLRTGGGQIRIALPLDAASGRGPGRGAGRGGRGPVDQFATSPGIVLPIERPKSGINATGWNQVEILLDANIVRAFLNDGAEVPQGVADEDAGRFGPFALYVGGAGEVRYKDVGWKDINVRDMPREQSSSNFRVQRLNEHFYSFSAVTGDVNHDGVADVIAGPYVYFGPNYTRSREVYLAETFNPSRSYASNSMVTVSSDFTGDGWVDVVNIGGGGATLYVNPKNEPRRWESSKVVTAVATEIVIARDVDGDGKDELVYGAEGYIRYAKPDPANPTGPWVVHTISELGPWGYLHSIGAGDVNGDGKLDLLSTWGWWEQPKAGAASGLWKYHPEAFGQWTRSYPGGGDIVVYDVNGDGKNDVVTPMQAHGIGLAWFEQKRDAAGNISFVRHWIMEDYLTKNAGNVTFTQLHATTMGDVDGDGVPDLIVGKRYWSHQDDFYDPDSYGAPVIYWYRTVRNPKAPGGAEFVPELIHNRSGVGSTVTAVDLNKDGALDITTSTDRGTFIFWGKPKIAPAGGAK